MSEAGVAGFSFFGWYGIVAPARTPGTVIKELNRGLVQVLTTPAVIERVAAMGNEPVASTPVQFDRLIRNEIPKWGKVIRDARISLAP